MECRRLSALIFVEIGLFDIDVDVVIAVDDLVLGEVDFCFLDFDSEDVDVVAVVL